MSKGLDIVAQAQSGTGKTGAFTIGALTRVDCAKLQVQVLILEPTKELATQTRNVLSSIGSVMGLVVQCSIGGLSVGEDIAAYRKGVHAVVGTPGRILDLIRRRNLSTSKLRVLVVDEADTMLRDQFQEALQAIMQEIPSSCQVALYSATLPPETIELTSMFMKDPVRITLTPEEVVLSGISQYYIDLGDEENKLGTLEDLFSSLSVSQSIVFCNTRRKADWLTQRMQEHEYPVVCIHSDMAPAERAAVMQKFINGSYRFLITTDLLARGIDVQGVEFVVNYDFTRDFDNYIHRIGRGGRFGRKGVAINFVTAQDRMLLKQLCQFYKHDIPFLPSDFILPG